jgi:Rod binding domain-containing protein
MTPVTLNPLTPAAQTADARATGPSFEEREALKQFEAIFLRQLLGSLEKAGTFAGKKGPSSGSALYGSMMVGAMADAAADAGGIGLVSLFQETLQQRNAAALATPEPAKSGGARTSSEAVHGDNPSIR